MTRMYLLTKNADVAGTVDCSLQCSSNSVSVGDNSNVGGLIVDLGAAGHCPRRVKLPVNTARFDAERRIATLRVGVVELNQMKTTTGVECVLAQQKLRPGPNLTSTSKTHTLEPIWRAGPRSLFYHFFRSFGQRQHHQPSSSAQC